MALPRLIRHVAGPLRRLRLIDENNNVVHVFQRCQPLPFTCERALLQHLFNLLPQELELIVNSLLRRLRETHRGSSMKTCQGLATNEEVRVDLEGGSSKTGAVAYVLAPASAAGARRERRSCPRVFHPADGRFKNA